MDAVKRFMFWALYVTVVIAKLPITLLLALFLWIEESLLGLAVQLVKWYGDDDLTEAVNLGLELNAAATKSQGDDYLDMKIEL